MHSKSIIFCTLLLLYKCNRIVSMNSSEIDSLISLHDRVKETLIQMLINGKCDSPKPTVVYVNESTDKIYLPRATVVHRCSDQFSCCPNSKHSCRAVEEQQVDVGFYTLIKTEDAITERGIEILKFINHTKCSCVRNNETLVKNISQSLDSNNMKTIAETNVSVKTYIKSINNSKMNDLDKKNSSFTPKNNDTNLTINSLMNISTTVLPEMNFDNSTNNTLLNREDNNNIMSAGTELPLNSKVFFATTLKTFSALPTKSKSINIPTEEINSAKTTKKSIEVSKSKPLFIPKSTDFLTSLKTLNVTTFDSITSNSNTKPLQKTTQTYRKFPFLTSKTWSSTTSTINYDELEREEDLNPQEDVVYSGVNFVYTKSIVVLPRMTPSFRYPTIPPECE